MAEVTFKQSCCWLWRRIGNTSAFLSLGCQPTNTCTDLLMAILMGLYRMLFCFLYIPHAPCMECWSTWPCGSMYQHPGAQPLICCCLVQAIVVVRPEKWKRGPEEPRKASDRRHFVAKLMASREKSWDNCKHVKPRRYSSMMFLPKGSGVSTVRHRLFTLVNQFGWTRRIIWTTYYLCSFWTNKQNWGRFTLLIDG